jgi:Aerotolerance regulator N-terminal
MSLGFVNPALLWGLLAAAIPVAIHLFFRRRPRPTPFPAIDFILKARRETQRRLRLKKLLLFTARTLVLAAVAAAIARPRLEEEGKALAAVPKGPAATAIVLDASASMRYRLSGKPLFERARADALGALAALGPEEPATALVCGSGTPTAEPPSFDTGAVRRTLERAEAEAGYADLTACFAAAVRTLTESKAQESLAKRIVIATDLAASAWRLDVPPAAIETPQGRVRPEVTVLDAARGAPLPNTAITGLDAEPDPAAGPRGYRITVHLVNWSKEPVKDAPLQLVVGTGKDAKTAIRPFADVPANGAARKQLSYGFPAGGPAAITVTLPEDALHEDDSRSLALVVPREVRVLVVDGAPSPVRYRDEAYFVESALASPASPVRPTLVDAESFVREDLSAYDVVFLLNVQAQAARADELARFLDRGGGLFIAVGDQVEPEEWTRQLGAVLPMPLHVVKTAVRPSTGSGRTGSEPARGELVEARAGAARFADVAWDHPALSIFTGDAREGFLGVRTFRYVLAKPRGSAKADGDAKVLVTFDDGAPALVEARRGKGRVLLFTSSADRDWTDWPIRTSFLPAMQRFAGWLAGGLDDRREPAVVVGAPRTLRLEEGESLAALVGPDGRERRRAELERAGLREDARGQVKVTPREPGLWQVKLQVGGQERVEPRLAFAVAPDPRESDTRRLDPAELTAWFGGESHAKVEGDARAAAGGGREVPLWSILLVLGLAAFLLEGVLLA